MKTSIRKIVTFLSVATVLFAAFPLKADMSENICRAHMPIISQAINLRQSGIPISNATDMADGAYDVSRELYSFLVGAIRFAYKEPGKAQQAINNGRMLSLCTKEVRGY